MAQPDLNTAFIALQMLDIHESTCCSLDQNLPFPCNCKGPAIIQALVNVAKAVADDHGRIVSCESCLAGFTCDASKGLVPLSEALQ